MDSHEPTPKQLLKSAGLHSGRTLSFLLAGLLAMALLATFMLFGGLKRMDTLSNRGLALGMVLAISVMVGIWLGLGFALDRWVWKPRIHKLPIIPPLRLLDSPDGLPTPQPGASRTHHIAHAISLIVIALLGVGALSPFFMRGPAEILVLVLSWGLYPFVYAGARIWLARLGKKKRA